jgi:hypothetical protein
MSKPATVIAGPEFTGKVIALPFRWYEDRPGKWVTEVPYIGLYPNIVGLSNSLGGLKEIHHENGPFYKLTATFQGFVSDGSSTLPDPNAQIITTYELDSSQIEKDIWQLPKYALAIDSILALPVDTNGTSLQRVLRFKADVEAMGRGELSTVDLNNPSKQIALTYASLSAVASAIGFPTALMNELLGLFGRGVNSYPLASHVLRKLQIAPSESNLVPQGYGVNQMWSSGTLLAQESSMPFGIGSFISAYLSRGYWLKGTPRLSQRNDQRTGSRIEVATEWTFTDYYAKEIFGQAL